MKYILVWCLIWIAMHECDGVLDWSTMPSIRNAKQVTHLLPQTTKTDNAVLKHRWNTPSSTRLFQLENLSHQTYYITYDHAGFLPSIHEQIRKRIDQGILSSHAAMDAEIRYHSIASQGKWAAQWLVNMLWAHEAFVHHAASFIDGSEVTSACIVYLSTFTCEQTIAAQLLLHHYARYVTPEQLQQTATLWTTLVDPDMGAKYPWTDVVKDKPLLPECFAGDERVRRQWTRFQQAHDPSYVQKFIQWMTDTSSEADKWTSSIEDDLTFDAGQDKHRDDLYRTCYIREPTSAIYHPEAWRAVDQHMKGHPHARHSAFTNLVLNHVEKNNLEHLVPDKSHPLLQELAIKHPETVGDYQTKLKNRS